MSRTPQQQVVHFVSDMYSVEEQALAQLVSAPEVVGEPSLAEAFRVHYQETQQQADAVRRRLEELGGSPSTIKDAVMRLGGKGFLLFAQALPETPGRLVDHAYSYEAMEWAGYDLLMRFAQRAGDGATAEMAKTIRSEERTMMDRLEQGFDAAEQASHAETPPEQMDERLRTHLAEAHAFEAQAEALYRKSEKIAGSPTLHGIYSEQLDKVREHARLVEERLTALSSSPSAAKDFALAAGGVNWGLFFQAQSDTAAKLAGFLYAFIHLEIGGYELLKRSARRAGDAPTAQLAESILAEKRAMAEQLRGAFDAAVDATLEHLRY